MAFQNARRLVRHISKLFNGLLYPGQRLGLDMLYAIDDTRNRCRSNPGSLGHLAKSGMFALLYHAVSIFIMLATTLGAKPRFSPCTGVILPADEAYESTRGNMCLVCDQ